MVIDTDVWVWCLRGNPRAVNAIESMDRPPISVVSYMELLQGARDRAETRQIRDLIVAAGAAMWPLSESVGQRAAVYMEEYALKSALSMADALIAATATDLGQPVLTANVKHFRVIGDLEVRRFRP